MIVAVLLGALTVPAIRAADAPSAVSPWPTVAPENRPMTRWWWLGSAVDEANLSRLLTLYHKAGLGGVEICPIYGAKGYESRFIDYLSPRWVDMLAYTTTEARKLGLEVDLTTGTGWPFGGPWVTPAIASSSVVLKRYELSVGGRLDAPLPSGELRCLRAVSAAGEQIDLTAQVRAGRLDWTAPPGSWRLYAVLERSPVQQVKRAAPGGQGNVLDPYSPAAMSDYLAHFDRALAHFSAPWPHAEFHDSFEYYDADWTPAFFQAFRQLRGYDLRAHLPALFGDASPEAVARVKCDYRATIAELHRDYIARWTDWAHSHGEISREQAHGSPGNLIDVYATADIPETETFGPVEPRSPPMLRFASSAAHLAGRPLASAESFTWLGEHFQVALSDVKPVADALFLAGINHLVYHGTPYSPADVPWPGWLFYAAVNFGPEGGLWHDLPALNAYVTRCQSILQRGRPDNDVLLYFPIGDFWQTPRGLLITFPTPGQWMWHAPFCDAAMAMENHGYSYDEVSDRFLTQARYDNGSIVIGGNSYRTVLVPGCRVMPVATLRRLVQLADAGATVLFTGGLPTDVPGLHDLAARQTDFHALLAQLHFSPLAGTSLRAAPLGRGRFLVGSDASALLEAGGVPREPMADRGLRCIRRLRPGGCDYFIVNCSDRAVDAWVPLGTPARSALLLDPMFADRAGAAAVRQADGTAGVYLQLQPGESRVLRTDFPAAGIAPWEYTQPTAAPRTLSGDWQVHFLEGGPVLPRDYTTATLASWTERDDPEAKRFAGTARYTLTFDCQPGAAADWRLDLGRVCDSARVTLNGHDITTLWCLPFAVRVGPFLRPGRNVLQIDVTNVAANRIADLDRRHVNWKSFYEINFVNKDYRPFDASHWPLRDSGLIGPVRLLPLQQVDPNSAPAP